MLFLCGPCVVVSWGCPELELGLRSCHVSWGTVTSRRGAIVRSRWDSCKTHWVIGEFGGATVSSRWGNCNVQGAV